MGIDWLAASFIWYQKEDIILPFSLAHMQVSGFGGPFARTTFKNFKA